MDLKCCQKWKIQQWRRFFTKRDNDDYFESEGDENKDPKKLGKDTHLKRRRF